MNERIEIDQTIVDVFCVEEGEVVKPQLTYIIGKLTERIVFCVVTLPKSAENIENQPD